MDDTIHVKGLRELGKMLQAVPIKMERNVMRGALRMGANIIRAQVIINAPSSPPSTEGSKIYGGYEGALRDSIRVGTRSKAGKVRAYVRAGGRKKADIFYAIWVERGTDAHWINSKSGYLSINGRRVKAPVLHPGARAHPFMRPALDSEASRALVAVGNYIKHRLDIKNGFDTAGITIEMDES